MIPRSCTIFAFELEPIITKNCDAFTHSYDFCIVTTRNYDFFIVVMCNCVAVFRNYGSECDRSYAVTASQFDRNETHGIPRMSNGLCERKQLRNKTNGTLVNNLRYADDIDLIDEDYRSLQEQLEKTRAVAEQAGLIVNVEKTKTMVFGD